MNFSKEDLLLIEKKGIKTSDIINQLQVFKKGLPFINLHEAATLDNGILQIENAEKEALISFYNKQIDQLNVVKFIPASGAATRMFKFLFQFLESYNKDHESINAYINKHNASQLSVFLVGLEKFPFYKTLLQTALQKDKNFEHKSINDKVVFLIQLILAEQELNYSNYPKGLLPFHKYKDHIATAFEEHLFEAAKYAASNGVANLHFTISEKHKYQFDKEFEHIKTIVEQKTHTKFNISFSYQEESTDTIAVNSKLQPFRDQENNLHFRPSGHGALLKNLNALSADLIFIKNIDNVVIFKYEDEIATYKKLLAGLLLKKQHKIFNYLKILEKSEIKEQLVIEIKGFLSTELNVEINKDFNKFSKKYQIDYLTNKLNRPIRVCGMVKNEGEPGGGPFWVINTDGSKSLQIVETAQVDISNKKQLAILNSATHFNPVDIVCSTKDYKGNSFDLNDFIDENAAFITQKTRFGKVVYALELPGLWNGSMAKWNTIFVEVPLITFNPVKTVNDLLKPAHQV
ncbi:DUF4301 family protein [Aurantibacter aestuarii]|uniref:DUF4301 domain-containing protein n=1 Tax=Aurantibacter aestuarii TaxID=1266046 RepID=A0A2T1NCA5_9FLAO|nr:DUF4301 family protein [Aurantibacter aestuarii]PSG90073.1 DUF4301 domain-containing protein [Aurantibacter aestuarii]